jgi:phosphoenolpyruvate carboxylase
LKAADSLVERKNIKMENLFLSLKNYRQAIMILNLYDFRPDDKLRAEILEKFQKTENMLNARIRDLRFRIGKSLKIGETRSLFEAAKEIMNLIPDPENQHYQYAQKYFLRYRDKYEDKFALGRR